MAYGLSSLTNMASVPSVSASAIERRLLGAIYGHLAAA